MKTVKKKNAVLEFDRIYLDCDTAQTYEVSLGTQRLGHVSYERAGGTVFITDMFVNPEYSRFGVETQILEALISSDEIHTISAVVPLSSADTYGSVGFVCDPSHVLMSKTK
jgi:GNAT superfamily N-acetyltransferase